MRRKSKSAVKKNPQNKEIETKCLSKRDEPKQDEFDHGCDFQSSTESDKISLVSIQDNYRLLIDESTPNDSSQESLSNSSIISGSKTYIFIQLKLISVDASCSYNKLEQNFLCISSEACASHLKTFIYKKMRVSQSLYDVVLMCNGYEIKSNCPMSVLKNSFFSDKLFVDIYYAIVESKTGRN